MAGRPIPVATASDMTKLYADYIQYLPVPTSKKTESVSFTFAELTDWLRLVEPYSDELRICLSVYPDTSPDVGRVTAILWPYKDGQPATWPLAEGKDGGGDQGVPPYNEGSMNP
jgi:hypothetical protein